MSRCAHEADRKSSSKSPTHNSYALSYLLLRKINNLSELQQSFAATYAFVLQQVRACTL